MRSALVAIPLLLAGAAKAEAVPHYATFGAWVVACDNTRRCEARGFDAESPSRTMLSITRPAGTAGPTLRLELDGQPTPPTLRFDTTPFPPGLGAWTLRRDGQDLVATTRAPAVVQGFLTAARNSQRLNLDGLPQGVPLDGLVAAIGRMEEIGRQGALPLPARPRWRPPASLGAAAATALAAQTRRDSAAALTENQCGESPAVPDDEAHALDARHALVLLGCGRGAYQEWSLGILADRRGRLHRPVALRMPTDPEPLSLFIMGGFDPAQGWLSFLAKGRGMADCGRAGDWIWSDGAFRMVSARRLDRCGGAGPGDFLTLHRSRPAR